MSVRPIAPSPALARLIDEGFEVEVRSSHLLLHAVPYVTSERVVQQGTLVCTYIESGGILQPPDNHQVWWTGEYPCLASGAKLTALENEHNRQELFAGCTILHRFSNKPSGLSNFPDHYQKMVHYVTLLSDQARALDPAADARTGRVVLTTPEESVHRYADTASARAEILGLAPRLRQKVAIVGLGGTGSYVLDQVAKTHAAEIHLFDGDRFKQHNAFRAPGAATFEELTARLSKVEYFRARYDHMHRYIHGHEYFIGATNVGELDAFDFIFVCVDQGGARRLICDHLIAKGIPFVDVGMSVELVPESKSLIGTCRTTLVTPKAREHVSQFIPFDEGDGDPLYRSNIQVADLNALNAQLAVLKWKQYSGFWHDDFGSHHDTYSVSSQSLTRDVLTKAAVE